MDFTIDRADLLAAIDKCALAVPDPKHPIEALRVMTVDASKKATVRFAAVGEFCSVDTVSKADIKGKGDFNVYPRHLRDIASSMPQGRVQLSRKGDRITVKSLVSSRKATFQHHSLELRGIEDPGKGASWQQVDSHELVRALKMVRSASIWDERNDPVMSLLLPTERGLDVFGCNGYLISLIETSIRILGEPIWMPATAVAVLLLMAPDDANIRLLSDGHRVYLENADTLVSASLPAQYAFATTHPHLIGLLKDESNVVGPTFAVAPLTAGVKAVLSLAGFAGEKDKKGARGYQLKAVFGETVSVELGFSEADARDEFDVIATGAELEFRLSSKFLDQMLSSLADVEQVQALRADNMLVLRSQGVLAGIMEERP
jgi:hypothetical protein